MTLQDDQDELVLVKAEIASRMAKGAADEYEITEGPHGRRLKKVALADLWKRRDELTARVSSSTAGGSFNYGTRGDW